MAEKTFYNVLEEQIRRDLRQEIRAEVEAQLRAERGPKQETSSFNPNASHMERVETWLATHVRKTFFKRSPSQKAYGSTNAHPNNARSTSTRPLNGTTTPPDATSSAHSSFVYTATDIEELCALELFRRQGVKIGDSFTENEIKMAWRKAALKTHPDRFAQEDAIVQAQMNAIFRSLCEAYKLLEKKVSQGDHGGSQPKAA